MQIAAPGIGTSHTVNDKRHGSNPRQGSMFAHVGAGEAHVGPVIVHDPGMSMDVWQAVPTGRSIPLEGMQNIAPGAGQFAWYAA